MNSQLKYIVSYVITVLAGTAALVVVAVLLNDVL
jgi:hypothetical protein